MKPAKNLSQISHRLLLRNHISLDNDHCRNILVERIIFTTMAATVSLCLIVFLIYKCFPRSNHSSDENPTETKPSIDVELASIPVLVFGEPTLPSLQPCCSDISLDLENCAICLEDYVHGDRVRVLPRCKHMFHKNCVEEWLQVPSLHCPICRDRILEHCLQSAGSNNCRNHRNLIVSMTQILITYADKWVPWKRKQISPENKVMDTNPLNPDHKSTKYSYNDYSRFNSFDSFLYA